MIPHRHAREQKITQTAAMGKVVGKATIENSGDLYDVKIGEIGDQHPVLIGQVPLEALDWVVDSKGQRLIGNPEHGGKS